MQLKRTFLLGVIGSLSLAALIGIWALLFDSFFGIEEEVFGTLGSVLLFCLPAMAASVMIEKRHWTRVMAFDLILCLVGVFFYVLVIWDILPWRLFSHGWFNDFIWKTMILLVTWAVVLPWTAMLAICRFRNWFNRIRILSIVLVFVTAAMISFGVIFDPNEDVYIRVLGAVGILAALGTITVPILAKVAGIDKDAGVESTALDIKITCPRCLLEQTVSSGHSRCSGCKLRFEIKIEEPRCPRCDYLLHKLTEPVCPECGFELGDDEVVKNGVSREPGAHDE